MPAQQWLRLLEVQLRAMKNKIGILPANQELVDQEPQRLLWVPITPNQATLQVNTQGVDRQCTNPL